MRTPEHLSQLQRAEHMHLGAAHSVQHKYGTSAQQRQDAVQEAFENMRTQGYFYRMKRQMMCTAFQARNIAMAKCQRFVPFLRQAYAPMAAAWQQFLADRQTWLNVKAQAVDGDAGVAAFEKIAEDARKKAGIHREEAQRAMQEGKEAVADCSEAEQDLQKAVDTENAKIAEMAQKDKQLAEYDDAESYVSKV